MEQYTNEVLITGQMDSSLEKAIGLSTQELDKFACAVKQISDLAGSGLGKGAVAVFLLSSFRVHHLSSRRW